MPQTPQPLFDLKALKENRGGLTGSIKKHRKAQRTFQYRPKQREYPRLKKQRKPATWIEVIGEEKEQTMTEKKEEGTSSIKNQARAIGLINGT